MRSHFASSRATLTETNNPAMVTPPPCRTVRPHRQRLPRDVCSHLSSHPQRFCCGQGLRPAQLSRRSHSRCRPGHSRCVRGTGLSGHTLCGRILGGVSGTSSVWISVGALGGYRVCEFSCPAASQNCLQSAPRPQCGFNFGTVVIEVLQYPLGIVMCVRVLHFKNDPPGIVEHVIPQHSDVLMCSFASGSC